MLRPRILSAIISLMVCFSAFAVDEHSAWLGDAIEWTPKQIIDYFRIELYDFQTDKSLPKDGYSITGKTVRGGSDIALLYAAYELWRQKHTEGMHDVSSSPSLQYRILDHWDNLDGSVERGYAGRSIFWYSKFGYTQWRKRIEEYARLNASVGINGTVLDNVNADAMILTPVYLDSVKIIADILRPYGIKVYLAVNFASPKIVGATKIADPLDASVKAWWVAKVKQIYKMVPDFGGFLVKANAGWLPGPMDYGRTHSDGANMLADALKPFGGIVIWRSYVYGQGHEAEDPVMQVVEEFKNLDGKFRDNVILQTKNGPLDNQPREPYAPFFDAMPQTQKMCEFQITQEYTGQSKHLVYLAPIWKEFFAYVIPAKIKGVAGVSNIGDDNNWCGHPFSQANWYAFGRMAWNPSLKTIDITKDWLRMTFPECKNRYFYDSVTAMMEKSREACVDYMMPLGLSRLSDYYNHYSPAPDQKLDDQPIVCSAVYYHKADSLGIGFDRTATGTNALSQYPEPYRTQFGSVKTCPEKYLLWFHHVRWNHKLKNGKTVWSNLTNHYNDGVKAVETSLLTWKLMRSLFEDENDVQRWSKVESLLMTQLGDAKVWEDACVSYFGHLNGMVPDVKEQHQPTDQLGTVHGIQ